MVQDAHEQLSPPNILVRAAAIGLKRVHTCATAPRQGLHQLHQCWHPAWSMTNPHYCDSSSFQHQGWRGCEWQQRAMACGWQGANGGIQPITARLAQPCMEPVTETKVCNMKKNLRIRQVKNCVVKQFFEAIEL